MKLEQVEGLEMFANYSSSSPMEGHLVALLVRGQDKVYYLKIWWKLMNWHFWLTILDHVLLTLLLLCLLRIHCTCNCHIFKSRIKSHFSKFSGFFSVKKVVNKREEWFALACALVSSANTKRESWISVLLLDFRAIKGAHWRTQGDRRTVLCLSAEFMTHFYCMKWKLLIYRCS